MIIQNIYNKRAYWLSGGEDVPTEVGFYDWKQKYIDNTFDKTKIKLNQLDVETFELCIKTSDLTDNVNFPNYYFEINVNKKTYYIYIDRLSRILNNVNIYICKIDNWTTYHISLLRAFSIWGYSNQIHFIRGHVGRNENEFPDDKLDEAYVPVMGRNTSLKLYSKNQLDLMFINPSSDNALARLGVYLVFKTDDIGEPFRFFPLLGDAAIDESGARTEVRLIDVATGRFKSGFNTPYGFNKMLTDTSQANPYANKFYGLFMGPNPHFINFKNVVQKVILGKAMIYFHFDFNNVLFADKSDSVIWYPQHSTFKICDFSNEEFWKLNTRNFVKSKQMLNVFKHKIGAQVIDFAKMWDYDNPDSLANPRLNLSGRFYFNTNIINVLSNPKLNREDRLFKFTANLPSSSSQYAQYVQSVFNTTNTGLQITKDKYVMNQASNVMNGVLGLVSSSIGGGVLGGLSSASKTIMGSVNSALGYKHYNQQLKANFKDKQLSMSTNNTLSSDEEALDVFNHNEYAVFDSDPYNRPDTISRNRISESNLIELNNVIVKYGWNVFGYYYWSDVAIVGLEGYTNFSYIQIDSDFLYDNYLPELNNSETIKSIPYHQVDMFFDKLINGVRLWNSSDNQYQHSLSVYNDNYWNGVGGNTREKSKSRKEH